MAKEKEKNQKQLEAIKECIDTLDMNRLWQLAQEDPAGVFSKITFRQLRQRRLERLQIYISALEHEQLAKNHSFELLLKNCVDRELGNAKKKGEKENDYRAV